LYIGKPGPVSRTVRHRTDAGRSQLLLRRRRAFPLWRVVQFDLLWHRDCSALSAICRRRLGVGKLSEAAVRPTQVRRPASPRSVAPRRRRFRSVRPRVLPPRVSRRQPRSRWNDERASRRNVRLGFRTGISGFCYR